METHDKIYDNSEEQPSGRTERIGEEFVAHVKALSKRAEESQATSKQLGLKTLLAYDNRFEIVVKKLNGAQLFLREPRLDHVVFRLHLYT